MTKTLDRSRPHGTIHPPHEGAHFAQDGYHFDADGKIVEKLLTPQQKAALVKKPAAPKPPNPQPQAEATETPGQSGGSGAVPPITQTGADDGGVNLEQWLRDEQSANFLDVRKAVKKRYSVWETTKSGVVILLVNEQKLLLPDEIDPELRKLLPQSAQSAG